MIPPRPSKLLVLMAACVALATLALSARAQSPAGEPIYWRQNLFLIPYQWSAADTATGQTVVLYVSKDHGATWRAVSEAKPQVRAFNYHAEADGEFWFAIRTLDGRGNTLPAGPMLPELRVVVDTTIPRFEQLSGAPRGDGMLEIRWRVTDANFDPRTCAVEAEIDRVGNWQAATPSEAVPVAEGVWEARATLPIAAGSQATAVRVTAFDRARNRAVYQSGVAVVPGVSASSPLASAQAPAIISGRGEEVASSTQLLPNGVRKLPPVGDPFAAASAVPLIPPALPSAPVEPAAPAQEWVADRTADALVDDSPAYVTPPSAGPFLSAADSDAAPQRDADWTAESEKDEDAIPQPIADDRPLGDVPATSRSPYAPIEPFRQASMMRAVSVNAGILPIAGVPPRNLSYLWLDANADILPADVTPKLVNSRTFALEYALEQSGYEGVARVELWGSRDGGKTWRAYATDDDNRSPLIVTVDGEGLYGFRMVVESAAGCGGFAPQPGAKPELWVGVDRHKPDVTFTDYEPGAGDDVGKLLVRWEAEDDNLEPRPIALFYSSRPTGPWTTIATNLANTGEYAWRLERFVPPRAYLRIEARDTAGNVAAYHTTEPLNVEQANSVARISGVESMPTSSNWSAGDSSR